MGKKVIFVVVLIVWLSSDTTATPARNQISRIPLYAATSFDYDYGVEQRQTSSTTERPIVRYWNNFVRNLPIPPIPWNMTNTLTNLFNAGASNALETPVGNYHENSSSGSSDKRKSSQKHKTSKKGSKNRKRPLENYDQEEDNEQFNEVKVRHQQPNVLLGSIPAGVRPDRAMYFYDPNSNQYFEVKRLRAVEQYMQNNYYNGVGDVAEDNLEDELQEAEELIPQIQIAHNTEAEEESDVMNSDAVMDGADPEELDEAPKYVKKAVGLAMEKIADKPKKNEEMLRNVIGSYMQDDRFSRKRQRANTQRRASSRNKDKLSPRDNFRYYYLQG